MKKISRICFEAKRPMTHNDTMKVSVSKKKKHHSARVTSVYSKRIIQNRWFLQTGCIHRRECLPIAKRNVSSAQQTHKREKRGMFHTSAQLRAHSYAEGQRKKKHIRHCSGCVTPGWNPQTALTTCSQSGNSKPVSNACFLISHKALQICWPAMITKLPFTDWV
jgi:hypothetical protein